jgi:hypothetical protein
MTEYVISLPEGKGRVYFKYAHPIFGNPVWDDLASARRYRSQREAWRDARKYSLLSRPGVEIEKAG